MEDVSQSEEVGAAGPGAVVGRHKRRLAGLGGGRGDVTYAARAWGGPTCVVTATLVTHPRPAARPVRPVLPLAREIARFHMSGFTRYSTGGVTDFFFLGLTASVLPPPPAGLAGQRRPQARHWMTVFKFSHTPLPCLVHLFFH